MEYRFVSIRDSTKESGDPGSGTGERLVARPCERHGVQPPSLGSAPVTSAACCTASPTAWPAPVTVSLTVPPTWFAVTGACTVGTLTEGRRVVPPLPPAGVETPRDGGGAERPGLTAAGAVGALGRAPPLAGEVDCGAPPRCDLEKPLGAPRVVPWWRFTWPVVVARARAGRRVAETGRARVVLTPAAAFFTTAAGLALACSTRSAAPPLCGTTPAPTPATSSVAAAATALDHAVAIGSDIGTICSLPPHVRARRKP